MWISYDFCPKWWPSFSLVPVWVFITMTSLCRLHTIRAERIVWNGQIGHLSLIIRIIPNIITSLLSLRRLLRCEDVVVEPLQIWSLFKNPPDDLRDQKAVTWRRKPFKLWMVYIEVNLGTRILGKQNHFKCQVFL